MLRSAVFRSAVYKALVFTTALLCLLSFANAEHFAPKNAEEITHYSGDDSFICSRTTSDDRSDIPQSEFVIAVLHVPAPAISQSVLPALQQSYTLHDIRGPPVLASLI